MSYEIFFNSNGFGIVYYVAGRKYTEDCYFETLAQAEFEANRRVNRYEEI